MAKNSLNLRYSKVFINLYIVDHVCSFVCNLYLKQFTPGVEDKCSFFGPLYFDPCTTDGCGNCSVKHKPRNRSSIWAPPAPNKYKCVSRYLSTATKKFPFDKMRNNFVDYLRPVLKTFSGIQVFSSLFVST
jgi:hypothetical protein